MAEEPTNAQETDIVKRLRYWEGEYHYPAGLLTEAAFAIEIYRQALEKIVPLGGAPGLIADLALSRREFLFGPRHPR